MAATGDNWRPPASNFDAPGLEGQPTKRELYDKFEVIKLLGKGSYGTVHKVKRKSDGNVYAMKEADVKKMSPSERADAVNEIRLLASIKHPNVIKYQEAFLDGPLLCIIMEFAPGGDLGRLIKKGAELKKALPEGMIWSYITQISLGLNALHQSHVLHRDIKPLNIFLGQEDVVKLGDLGIAKMMKEDIAKTQIGTPHYMAPEIWMGRPYSFGTDLWALGCLIYEMITYRPPFEASNMADLRTKIVSGAFKPFSPGKYSEDLVRVMHSLLAVNSAQRLTLVAIFMLPQVQKVMASLAPAHLLGVQQDMISTIKVPFDLRLLDAQLPKAAYDENHIRNGDRRGLIGAMAGVRLDADNK